jgi:hypothetical protein
MTLMTMSYLQAVGGPPLVHVLLILNGVVVIVVVLWLLQVFGLIGNLTNIRVGR